MKKKIVLVLVGFVGLILFSFSPPGDRFFELAKNLEIFGSLFREVNALYVDDINPNVAARHSIDAMLNSLDPYTNYIPEDEVEDYRTQNTGQYGGARATPTTIRPRNREKTAVRNYPPLQNEAPSGRVNIK